MVLIASRPKAIISLAVDASATNIGGILQQIKDGSWQPLAFFSRKLSKPEEKYSPFDRELFAAYSPVKHFRFVLEGWCFHLLTDHKPLMAAIARISLPCSGEREKSSKHSFSTSDFDFFHILRYNHPSLTP